MTCERYWREGVLLVERGGADPHRASCAECRDAFRSHEELVEALSLVGAGDRGGADWQDRVWQRIAAAPPAPRRQWQSWLAPAFAIACVVAVVCAAPERPRVELVSSDATRGIGRLGGVQQSANLDDEMRISARPTEEIRIYRSDRLVLRCVPRLATTSCTPDAAGTVASVRLAVPGAYQIVIVDSPRAAPTGAYDRDTAELRSRGTRFDLVELTVR